MLDSACKYQRSLMRRAPANSVGGRCFNPAPVIVFVLGDRKSPSRSITIVRYAPHRIEEDATGLDATLKDGAASVLVRC